MDFKEAMTKISEFENGKEFIEAIQERIRKVNSEAKSLREKMKEYKIKADKYDIIKKCIDDIGIQ